MPTWQDAKLIAFDFWLTGVHPSIWLEQFTTPFRNDFMQFTYFTYFTYLLILGGILYYRKDWRAYWSVMTYSVVAYSIGYMIAMSFPIESPWFSMAGIVAQANCAGGPFTALINFIEHYGRVRGAAFPSEHVAGSFAALVGSVAAPALVVLGDAAARVVHVRVDDLWAVSLRRGHIWWDYDGNDSAT